MPAQGKKICLYALACGSCFLAVSIASACAVHAFDANKFPGRGKRDAFARSCLYYQKDIALEEKGKPKEARKILGTATGLATTAALKKVIAADLEKARIMLDKGAGEFSAPAKTGIPR